MATHKKPSKRYVPRTEILNLSERESFLKDELPELLGWSNSRIDGYIRNGQIRRAFDTTNRDKHLCDWKYYKCNLGNERLSAMSRDDALSDFVDPIIEENFISCPRYLYLPEPRPIRIPDPKMLEGTIFHWIFVHDVPEELLSGTWVMLSHFYHFDGDVLLPVEDGGIIFPLVKLEEFELLEFPLEEIERLKQKNHKRRGKKSPSVTIAHKKEVYRIITEEFKIDSQKIPYPGDGRAGIASRLRKFCNDNKIGLTESQINTALRLLKKENRIKFIEGPAKTL